MCVWSVLSYVQCKQLRRILTDNMSTATHCSIVDIIVVLLMLLYNYYFNSLPTSLSLCYTVQYMAIYRQNNGIIIVTCKSLGFLLK